MDNDHVRNSPQNTRNKIAKTKPSSLRGQALVIAYNLENNTDIKTPLSLSDPYEPRFSEQLKIFLHDFATSIQEIPLKSKLVQETNQAVQTVAQALSEWFFKNIQSAKQYAKHGSFESQDFWLGLQNLPEILKSPVLDAYKKHTSQILTEDLTEGELTSLKASRDNKLALARQFKSWLWFDEALAVQKKIASLNPSESCRIDWSCEENCLENIIGLRSK